MKSSIHDLEIYRESLDIAEEIWNVVVGWRGLARETVSGQIVRSVDSIAANLAEGYGRYHFKENRKFCYYSRGSAEETQCWIEKSVRRGLMNRELGRDLYNRLEELKKRINAYIRSIGRDQDSPDDR